MLGLAAIGLLPSVSSPVSAPEAQGLQGQERFVSFPGERYEGSGVRLKVLIQTS